MMMIDGGRLKTSPSRTLKVWRRMVMKCQDPSNSQEVRPVVSCKFGPGKGNRV
jgi:hypothetical protein